TGDRGRFLPDGNIEFLGRFDNQLKIRGVRIEPSEIETVLRAHPSVQEAVIGVAGAVGDERLIGYVVPRAGASGPGDLRAFVRDRLPDYMVPSSFVVLHALPLTPNGKVDRRALPAPDTQPADGSSYQAARTDAERILAGIWAGVLGLERVGVEDNFFSLGGDSILSIQAVSRARQAGLRLTTKDMFLHQTIAEL